MSQADTPRDLEAISRNQINAVNRRDIDAVMRFAATDCVYDTSPSDLGVYEGPEAVRVLFGTTKGKLLGATNVRRRILAKAVEQANRKLVERKQEQVPKGVTPPGRSGARERR